MKRVRIINAAILVAIAIVIIVMVCMEWSANGYETKSLVLAILFYTASCTMLAGVIDATIQGK